MYNLAINECYSQVFQKMFLVAVTNAKILSVGVQRIKGRGLFGNK